MGDDPKLEETLDLLEKAPIVLFVAQPKDWNCNPLYAAVPEDQRPPLTGEEQEDNCDLCGIPILLGPRVQMAMTIARNNNSIIIKTCILCGAACQKYGLSTPPRHLGGD